MHRREAVADLPPCHGAFVEASPVRLRAVADLAGAAAGPFRRILVLDCGTGVGPAILSAALHGTGAEVWGATPEAEDAAIARALAEEADLDARILHAGPETLADRTDLPRFDLIAMPWGWDAATSPERAALMRLLSDRLGPGGGFLRTAGVTGAAPEQFLRRLAANRLAAAPRELSPEARARWAASDIGRLFAESHAMVRHMPDWKTRAQEMAALPPQVFLRAWGRPTPPPETIRETGAALAAAGFSGWVPADPQRLARDLDMTATQTRLVDEAEDPWVAAETADLMTNRARRIDLFLKPGGAAPDPGAVRLAPAGARPQGPVAVHGLLGPTTLAGAAYQPLLDLLHRRGPVALADAATEIGESLEIAAARAAVLIGAGLAFPAAEPTPEATAACARLNAILKARGCGARLASAVAGGAVPA